MIEELFENLGKRLFKENPLSDFTWAMAESCENFLQTFMKFFKFKLNPDAPLEIFREDLFDDGSRPDFVIQNGDRLFVVENKIYDTNYHFKKYGEIHPPKGKKILGRAIITNHKIDDNSKREAEKYNFKVELWEKFVEYLKEELKKKKFDSKSEKCLKAYVKYVKEVCSIMELQAIRCKKLSSLFYFNKLVEKLLKNFLHDEVKCHLYLLSSGFSEGWSGQYFSLKKKRRRTTLYPWLGINYMEEPPTISVDFEKGKCTKIYTQYKAKRKNKETDFYYSWADDWGVYFCLKKDKFDDFMKAPLEKQEALLRDFLKKVLDEIIDFL